MKLFKKLIEDMKKAKPGDTIEVAGLPVLLQTPEECEKAEVHICMRTADMKSVYWPSMKGNCSRCGHEIWISLDSPTKPPKVCHVCARAFVEEETVTE